jgi:hypothetical protein
MKSGGSYCSPPNDRSPLIVGLEHRMRSQIQCDLPLKSHPASTGDALVLIPKEFRYAVASTAHQTRDRFV